MLGLQTGRIGVLACAKAAKRAANHFCLALKCTGEDAYTPRTYAEQLVADWIFDYIRLFISAILARMLASSS
jgi:hypothetical protein